MKTQIADFILLYKNRGALFKHNISIDNGCFHTYRTIILQPLPAKRLTTVKFFEKN